MANSLTVGLSPGGNLCITLVGRSARPVRHDRLVDDRGARLADFAHITQR